MRIYDYSDKRLREKAQRLLFLFFLFSFSALFSLAEAGDEVPIKITSDRLISDNKSDIITFEGHVKAVKGDLTITAKKIDILSNKKSGGVKMIVARGDVHIYQHDKHATGEKAVYYEKQQKIILTGNPKSWEGENLITGNEMTFDIRRDKIIVKQSRKEQVRVIFYPKEKKK